MKAQLLRGLRAKIEDEIREAASLPLDGENKREAVAESAVDFIVEHFPWPKTPAGALAKLIAKPILRMIAEALVQEVYDATKRGDRP